MLKFLTKAFTTYYKSLRIFNHTRHCKIRKMYSTHLERANEGANDDAGEMAAFICCCADDYGIRYASANRYILGRLILQTLFIVPSLKNVYACKEHNKKDYTIIQTTHG